MELSFDFTAARRKYEAIYEQLKQKIIEQELAAHTKLPSKRQLAEQLQVSIQTIQVAYEQLLSEGYIYSVERSGYFVSLYEPEWQPQQPKLAITANVEMQKGEVPFDNLRNGQVDSSAFPYTLWQKLYRQQLQIHSLGNGEWQGEKSLRDEIACYVKKARGIQCQSNQVFIYSGTQQQLQALCLFLQTKRVAMEEPGFMRATTIFQQLNASIEYVPVDHMGATIPKTDCALYYITPAHQYPLGMIMPLERKQALLQWAKRESAYLIEDDYDAEFRYKGLPIPPLAQMDMDGRVIYFGTFSKTLIPSLRISYMILPPQLVEAFQTFNKFQKATVSKIDQHVIANFMREGHYEKHIAKMRTLYRKKREALLAALKTYLPKAFQVFGDEAGLHIVIKLPDGLTEREAIERAAATNIQIDAVSTMYQLNSPSNTVMLGFGAIALDRIDEVVFRLVGCWGVE